jgi:hypothetical protein
LLLLLKMWWLLLLWCGLLLLLLRILMDLRMLLQIWTSLFWRNADVSRRRCQVEFVSEILEIGKLFAPVSDPASVLRGRALLLLWRLVVVSALNIGKNLLNFVFEWCYLVTSL